MTRLPSLGAGGSGLALAMITSVVGCASPTLAPTANAGDAPRERTPDAATSAPPPPSVAASATAAPPKRPVRIFARGDRACALLDDASLQCWGSNGHGQLGAGHTEAVTTPQRVVGLRGVTRLALTPTRTCALTSTGELHCWGAPFLGAPDKPGAQPAHVASLTGGRDVAVGDDHACAIEADGALHCWGSNDKGQLGLGPGAPAQAVSPVRVQGLPPMEGVVAERDRTAAWSRAGDLYVWGGGGRKSAWRFDAPHRIASVAGVARMVTEANQFCVLRLDREVRCFGHETIVAFEQGRQHDAGPDARALAARLGARTRKTRPASRTGSWIVPDGRGLRDVVELVVSNHDASALTASGQVFSWGSPDWGTIPHVGETYGWLPPTAIPGATDIVAIAGGFTHRCVLDRAGVVACFGSGALGALGTPGALRQLEPKPVARLPRVVAIAANDRCSFAIGVDDQLYAWGDSRDGACGIGGEASTDGPVVVPLVR